MTVLLDGHRIYPAGDRSGTEGTHTFTVTLVRHERRTSRTPVPDHVTYTGTLTPARGARSANVRAAVFAYAQNTSGWGFGEARILVLDVQRNSILRRAWPWNRWGKGESS